MRKKLVRWCSLTPEYPEIGFCAVVTFVDQDMELSAIYPLEPVYGTIDELSDYAATLIPKLEEENPGYVALEHLTVFPLALKKLFTLTPEYWGSPNIDYTQLDRAQLFVKVAKMPQVFTLLVTPRHYGKKVWQLSAALPYFQTVEETILEPFMKHSNWPVEQKAKYAALYSVKRPVHVNWITGKISSNLPSM